MRPDDRLTEAQQIAHSVSTSEYFHAEQDRLLEEWHEQAFDNFRLTAEVFLAEVEQKSSNISEKSESRYRELAAKCKKEFEAFCILNRKVQKKSDEIENFANFFAKQTLKRNFFVGWAIQTKMQKYLRTMQERANRFHKAKLQQKCLQAWQAETMHSNKSKIRASVLAETDSQITKVQAQYERLIASLEETLEKKLLELKKEEEEHKLLHDKYETMYTRAKSDTVKG